MQYHLNLALTNYSATHVDCSIRLAAQTVISYFKGVVIPIGKLLLNDAARRTWQVGSAGDRCVIDGVAMQPGDAELPYRSEGDPGAIMLQPDQAETATNAAPTDAVPMAVANAQQGADAVARQSANAAAQRDANAGAPEGANAAVNAGAARRATGRGGRWFAALCALIAVAAAGVALAAPWLRPRLDTEARRWLGADNMVSRLVTSEPAATPATMAAPQSARATAMVSGQPPAAPATVAREPAVRPVPAAEPQPSAPPEPMVVRQPVAAAPTAVPPAPPGMTLADVTQLVETTLQVHRASDDQRVQAISASLDAARDELARESRSWSATIDALSQRSDRLQSASAVAAARVRAGAVLALAIGLRRDVDAGVPIDRDCAALRAIDAFPAPVDAALQQLTGQAAGIPTMRDLAETFETVQARLAVRTGSSLFGRGWMRVKTVFGLNSQAAEDVLPDHLQALVAEGRFSEAANVLETSQWAPLGADWVAMVRARAAGVVATQVILTYALHATEAAYAANEQATAPKLPQ